MHVISKFADDAVDVGAFSDELSAQVGQGARLAISYIVQEDGTAQIIVHDRDADGEDVSDLVTIEDVEAAAIGHGKKGALRSADKRTAKTTWVPKEQRKNREASLEARIEALEAQVAALSKQPVTPTPDPKPKP